jgi:hypothetical protein
MVLEDDPVFLSTELTEREHVGYPKTHARKPEPGAPTKRSQKAQRSRGGAGARRMCVIWSLQALELAYCNEKL